MSIQEIDDKTFDKEVLRGEGLALVDFSSPTCVPCKIVGQILVVLSQNYEHRVRFYKVDVDKNPSIANKFDIKGVPVLLLFKNGISVDRYHGPAPKLHIESMLSKHL